MITIKSDSGWENPQSWNDVTSLPGYVSEIDPKVSELFAVIGKYRESERKVCSISETIRVTMHKIISIYKREFIYAA